MNYMKYYVIVILEKLRGFIFWSKDFLTGAVIRKHFKSVKLYNENPTLKANIANRERALVAILNHTLTTVPYYKGLNLETNLLNFPVINKGIVNANLNDFMSLCMANKKSYLVSTSGSSGTIFKVYHDLNKKKRNSADVLYYAKQLGFNVGERLYYWRHWNRYYSKRKWVYWLQNIVPIEVFDFDEKKYLKLLTQLKQDKSTKHFIGHASAFERLCRFLDTRSDNLTQEINLKSAVAMAEHLTAYTKERMWHYFKVAVVSRYSNSENGIIAQQRLGDTQNYCINSASYIVELLNLDNDQPVSMGKEGRIVVTDLFNFKMPLVRYDTGDVGVMQLKDKKPILTKIVGRKSDIIYNTKGVIVPSLITVDFCAYKGIKQGQLIQESSKAYTIKLQVDNTFKSEKQLIQAFKEYLGLDALIKVTYVDEIPLLESGKRKTTINNFKK